MKFLDSDVKTMPSLSYTEYYEGVQSHECKKCRRPIQHKADYLLDNNDVSELPQVYLLCNCPKGLWLPLAKYLPPSDNQRDNQRDQRAVTVDDLNNWHWYLCNPNPSKYDAKNNSIYFTKCQKKEKDFFLQSYIKANIDPEKKLEDELESLANDYYKLCCDTIALNLKLGLFNVFLNNTVGHHHISARSGLENSINELIQYSNPIFWGDYVKTYFDSCIIRFRRLMERKTKKEPNCYLTYKNRYLKYYPEKKSKSGGIRKLNNDIKRIGDKYVAHNDRGLNPEELREPLKLLYCEYTNKVLESINTLNEMQGLKIVFSYDPGKLCLHKSIAMPILRIIDNVLKPQGRHTSPRLPWGDTSKDGDLRRWVYMDDRSFEELIGDLSGQGMRVYVSTGAGADIYHYSHSCLKRFIKTGKVRTVPVELVKWLGYAECKNNNCKPDK